MTDSAQRRPPEPAASAGWGPRDASAGETVAVDFAVVGSGLAGMYTALHLARHGRCILVTKAAFELSNSAWAQGGIAAALDASDDPSLHVQDTLRAGRGLCKRSAVEVLAREGPARVEEMLALGVPFVVNDLGRPELGLEGGHARRRIVHAGGGATGEAVVRALQPRVAADPNVAVWEDARAIALLTDGGRCAGVRVERAGAVAALYARATVLATGGACGLYSRTTNPSTTTGDGIALAYLAGAAVADMEFVQFHPTAYAQGHPAFLLSEALRGEGAQLYSADGERFMARYDPAGELAPRDVVAQAVTAEMARTRADHVELRLDGMSAAARAHFEPLFARLRALGFDPNTGPIPVAPAAHFLMGGVVVDLHGHSTLEGLYAGGEVSCTGVHGANRLASNSLLECMVFGHRIAASAAEAPPPPRRAVAADARAPLEAARRRALADWLFADAGIVREVGGLRRLIARCADLPPSPERLIAERIAEGALARTESRGAHFRSDYPAEAAGQSGHFVCRLGRPPRLERWE